MGRKSQLGMLPSHALGAGSLCSNRVLLTQAVHCQMPGVGMSRVSMEELMLGRVVCFLVLWFACMLAHSFSFSLCFPPSFLFLSLSDKVYFSPSVCWLSNRPLKMKIIIHDSLNNHYLLYARSLSFLYDLFSNVCSWSHLFGE